MSAETWHGTSGGYTNHACRCRPYTDAHSARHLEYMERFPIQRAKHRIRERISYWFKRRNWDRVAFHERQLKALNRAEELVDWATQ